MSKKSQKPGSSQSPAAHTDHRGNEVKVGPYTVLLGGTQYLQAEDLRAADVLIPLTETGLTFGQPYTVTSDSRIRRLPPLEPGRDYSVLAAPLIDFGGVPDNWREFLLEKVVPLLQQDQRVLAFCMASHGRTGTFLASLIALLEPNTTDPIAAARARHCYQAVESEGQSRAIFALRNEDLPQQYHARFHL